MELVEARSPIISREHRKEGQERQLCLDLVLGSKSRRKQLPRKKTGNQFLWTDDDLDKVVQGVFYRTMHALLDDRSSRKSRQEAFDWLMVPFANPYRGEKPAPLSFQFCCQWMGLSYAEVQEQAIEAMRRNGFLADLTASKEAETKQTTVKVA
jgi:hypothetical protein